MAFFYGVRGIFSPINTPKNSTSVIWDYLGFEVTDNEQKKLFARVKKQSVIGRKARVQSITGPHTNNHTHSHEKIWNQPTSMFLSGRRKPGYPE